MEREAGPMAGRVCIVTGPTSGIGTEIARGLAQRGATVVLAARNLEKGTAIRDMLARDTGNANLEVELVDLASLASIREFARRYQGKHQELHVLVNNAGLFLRHRQVTPDGMEMQFMVNTLAPFLLTNLLLEPLRRGAPSRVVNVSSAAHRGGHVNFEDLQREREYRSFRAYTDSKFALTVLTYEMARRWKDANISVNAVHPGVIRTQLGRHEYPSVAEAFRLFFKSPERGARTPLFLATSPNLDGTTGQYFANLRAVRSDDATYDEDLARRLWDVSARLVGLAT